MILLVLIALAARVDARAGDDAPPADAIELALRFADAITGEAPVDGDEGTSEDDQPDQDIDEDEPAADALDPVGDRAPAELTGGMRWAPVRRGRAPEDPVIDKGSADGEGGEDGEDGEDLAVLEVDGGGAGDDLARLAIDGDAGELAELADGDDGRAGAWTDSASGALAVLDAELAPGDAAAGLEAADATASAGAAEVYEQWIRHQRPSRWGRLDVGVSWRRRWSAPLHAAPGRYDEVWLLATWRR